MNNLSIAVSILLFISLLSPAIITYFVDKADKAYSDLYEEAYREDAMWEALRQNEIKEIQNQAILEKEYEYWKLSDEAKWLRK